MEPVTYTKEATAVDLGALLDAGDGAVVILSSGDTQLVAHRAVLAARSPVFAAMFAHDTLESSRGQVAVPDVDGPVLRQLLAYLYSLQAPQLPNMAPQLLAAADKYGVSDLKTDCERQVASQLTVENAAAAAVLGVKYSCPRLTVAAVAFIKAHNYEVMATQGWADAVLNHPKDIVEVSRLLADTPAETRSTAGSHSQSHSGQSWKPATAAPPTASENILPPDSATFSRMRIHSGKEVGGRMSQAAVKQRAETLMTSVADVGAMDDGGERTALHWAAMGGHLGEVRRLLDGGMQVGARDSDHNTPMHLAAMNGHAAVVRQLVASSGDPNARGWMGRTPLHWAAWRGHAEAAAVLLEAGANKEAVTSRGNTPLDLARQNNQEHMVAMLT